MIIDILALLDLLDIQPNDNDEYELHKYLNQELNGIECEHDDTPFRIPKHFRNLLIFIKSILY